MSARHRSLVVMALVIMGLCSVIVACSDGHRRHGRCGRGHGQASSGSVDADDDDDTDFDASTGGDVARIPAEPQVGDADAADPDAESDAEADAGSD